MSVEDLEYIENVTGESLDDDKPLSEIKRRSTIRANERGSASSPGISVQKKPSYDWFDFFLKCGVNPQICERYAQAFDKDQMGEENLPDITPALLRTLGLKEGDILRVTKHLDSQYNRSAGEGNTEEALVDCSLGQAVHCETTPERDDQLHPWRQTTKLIRRHSSKSRMRPSRSRQMPQERHWPLSLLQERSLREPMGSMITPGMSSLLGRPLQRQHHQPHHLQRKLRRPHRSPLL